jgi:hypothetical protein
MDDNPLIKAWQEASAALEEAEQDFTEEGRLRRIYITDKLADFSYRLHDVLKAQGRESEANQAHRKGNEFWGKVVRLQADGPPPPQPSAKSTDGLSVREAAHRLAAQRLSKLST